MTPMTCNMKESGKRPYFLWDEPLTIEALRQRLRFGDEEERLTCMARILREARFEDVWEFVSVEEVTQMWDKLRPRLGRKRAFWEFLLNKWREHGLIR